MAIELKITAVDAVELRHHVSQLSGVLSPLAGVQPTVELHPVPPAPPVPVEKEPAAEPVVQEAPKKATRAKKAPPAPAPTPVVEAPEVEAQDALDEEVEEAAAEAVQEALTPDSVRKVMMTYADTYGMEATQADLHDIFVKSFGQAVVNPDTGRAVVSRIPTDQASLAKAIEAVKSAIATNPYKRVQVGG